jgi:regulator of nonsense transcripts 1
LIQARELAKPPLSDSTKYANEVLGYLQINPDKLFPEFNGPQLSAIGASLTRRLTMIQGPPGTGKTTVAASIAFGFVHQCRNMPGYEKVLACAFSNVGADNLAEKMIKLGLKVIRVGKASGVSSSLWDYTLDAAIDKDPDAQKAIKAAAKATANLRLLELSSGKVDAALEKSRREAATQAVKASIEVSYILKILQSQIGFPV